MRNSLFGHASLTLIVCCLLLGTLQGISDTKRKRDAYSEQSLKKFNEQDKMSKRPPIPKRPVERFNQPKRTPFKAPFGLIKRNPLPPMPKKH